MFAASVNEFVVADAKLTGPVPAIYQNMERLLTRFDVNIRTKVFFFLTRLCVIYSLSLS
jgi:hypothetical protein